MKNFFSLLLVAILLINVLGYYGVFLGMRYQNDVAMIKRLDSNRYDESQTITIKVPIAVPYLSDDEDFERVDGVFEYNGEFYRLVKQRYAQDTLTVICVKDIENKRIHQALTNYVKSFSDKPSDQHQNSKLTISFIKYYFPQTFALKIISPGRSDNTITTGYISNLVSTFVSSVIHPPERG